MFREGLRPPDPFRAPDPFEAARTQDGMSLKALGDLSPVLVVCLPSTHRRPWLRALAEARPALEAAGVRVVIVHTGAEGELEPFDLQYVARIADKDRSLYRALELPEARAGLLRRHAVQLPGAFLMVGGEVRRAFRAKRPADLPDYGELAP